MKMRRNPKLRFLSTIQKYKSWNKDFPSENTCLTTRLKLENHQILNNIHRIKENQIRHMNKQTLQKIAEHCFLFSRDWTVNFTGFQSLTSKLVSKTWVLLLNLNWLVQSNKVQLFILIIFNLLKRQFCLY